MARLDRGNKTPRPSTIKVNKKSKNPTIKTLRKLLIINLIAVVISCIGNYDKYVELSQRLIEYLGY